MTYKLTFLKTAKKEWEKLPLNIRKQLKNKLIERLENPHILKDKLAGMENCYKIKLRASGFRLVYKVFKDRVTVQVIAIGKREKAQVYKLAHFRIN